MVLSDIHIDIMDYIKPAQCNESQVSCAFFGSLESHRRPPVVPKHVDRVRVGEQSQRQYDHHVCS